MLPEKRIIRRTIERRNQGGEPLPTRERLVLIMTALPDLEQSAVDKYLKHFGGVVKEDIELDDFPGVKVWKWERNENDLDGDFYIATLCLDSAGNGKSGVEYVRFAMKYRPQLTCFCGIAGSLNPHNATLGAVVVSTEISWLGYDKLSTKDDISVSMRDKNHGNFPSNLRLDSYIRRFLHEEARGSSNKIGYNFSAEERKKISDGIKEFNSNEPWLEKMKEDLVGFDAAAFLHSEKPSVKYGKIVSWEYVLNDKSTRESLLSEDRDRLALEMESGAPSYAAKIMQDNYTGTMCFVAFRGISDLCHVKGDDIFRFIAADGAAAVLVAYLKHAYNPKKAKSVDPEL